VTDVLLMWSAVGLILTGESRSARRRTCPSDTLSTTNPTRYGVGLKRSMRFERPAYNHLTVVTMSWVYSVTLAILCVNCPYTDVDRP
jgi:hypothetical protein